MTATGQSLTPTTVTARPVVRSTVAGALAPLARRAMPLVTASVGTALATLAAERAVAGLALRAAERSGLVRTRPTEDAVTRITVTHTTIVERIARPR